MRFSVRLGATDAVLPLLHRMVEDSAYEAYLYEQRAVVPPKLKRMSHARDLFSLGGSFVENCEETLLMWSTNSFSHRHLRSI